MGSVFAMQGIGQLAAALIALIVTTGFKESLLTAKTVASCSGVCQLAVDKMWRVIIGFGAVPGCIALYYRLTIPETPRYTFDVARDVEKAGEDINAYIQGKAEGAPDTVRQAAVAQDSEQRFEMPKAGWGDFFRHYSQWKYGKVLLGTAGSWFFLDVAFYGLGLNNTIILQNIKYATGSTVYQTFYNTAVGNLIIVCAGSIPGYWVTVATVDFIGRKPIQLMGFAMLTILFVIIGFAYNTLLQHNGALLALFVLAQFFFNFGTYTRSPMNQPQTNLPPQAPTRLPSSSPANASQHATAPPPTAYPPPQAKSAPSSRNASSALSANAAPQPAPPPPPGSTTSWRSLRSSCCAASSPRSSSPRPSARRSRSWRARCRGRVTTTLRILGTARSTTGAARRTARMGIRARRRWFRLSNPCIIGAWVSLAC